ncbi:saccharopine dehydrogenase NADP-binding domain-containing protein [Enterovibrio norvegicus]|uniref:Saccharopine dehydrogenase, NADP-dependent n=1 Tax=Enterovibrio norvegicus DSM 15893 TaxID=1121869 RepID=A0A1I5LGY8_9GAMM|nr:saccharopine dehydrogenase NADP-binding domain-containing protein [Enterovibrio norvegicus]SFO96558.1 Saccharopine dehydrogenase, NADP-dependent [Enterovibrio norvegicus DSM 15893]
MNAQQQKSGILVLGGKGQVGHEVVQYLLDKTSHMIVVASRSATPADFPKRDGIQRVSTKHIDVMDEPSLHSHCKQYSLVISCVGPSGIIGDRVAKACKTSGTAFIDAGGYDPVFQGLKKDEKRVPSSVPLIINVGLLPGLSGLFPKYVLEQSYDVSAIDEIEMQYVGRDAWSFNSAWDIINSLGGFGIDRGFAYFENNILLKAPFRQAKSAVNFPALDTPANTMLVYSEEALELVKECDIHNLRTYGTNIGPRAMKVCILAKLLGLYKFRFTNNFAARLLEKASRKDLESLSPFYGIQVTLLKGKEIQSNAQLTLTNTYQATGKTIGIAARCVLEGKCTKAGVLMLHQAIASSTFLSYLEEENIAEWSIEQNVKKHIIEEKIA